MKIIFKGVLYILIGLVSVIAAVFLAVHGLRGMTSAFGTLKDKFKKPAPPQTPERIESAEKDGDLRDLNL